MMRVFLYSALVFFATMPGSYADEKADKAYIDTLAKASIESKASASINCDALLKQARESGVKPENTPNKEGLEKAVHLYSFDLRIGQCLYPGVTAIRRPVGEYEYYKDGGPNYVTLTDRTVYRWGKYEIQEAFISTPEHLDIEVIPNGKGYRLKLSNKH